MCGGAGDDTVRTNAFGSYGVPEQLSSSLPSSTLCLLLPSVQAGCPQRIVFVLKEGEKWANSGGGDFVAHLKPPGVQGASSNP